MFFLNNDKKKIKKFDPVPIVVCSVTPAIQRITKRASKSSIYSPFAAFLLVISITFSTIFCGWV